jgi:hypothetical protein
VTESSGINSWADLKGKSISVGQSASAPRFDKPEYRRITARIDVTMRILGYNQSPTPSATGASTGGRCTGRAYGIRLDLFASTVGVTLLRLTSRKEMRYR